MMIKLKSGIYAHTMRSEATLVMKLGLQKSSNKTPIPSDNPLKNNRNDEKASLQVSRHTQLFQPAWTPSVGQS